LRDGEEVLVTLSKPPLEVDDDAFARAAGAWKDTVDADTLIARIYADRLLPSRSAPHV
jgi:hypothetical protein